MRKVFIIGYFALAAIILSLVFSSCKHNTIDDATALKNTYTNDSYFAPLSTAIAVAENVNKSIVVLKSVDKSDAKAAAYLGTRKIKDNLTILDKNKQNPYFYVFNYEAGGFAIISADKRQIPIVGFCDLGYFNKDSIPLGLMNWFEKSASYIQHLRISNAKQSEYVSNQWASLQSGQNQLKNAPVDPPLPDDYMSTVTVSPLLTTKWSQDQGYNTYCPVLSGGPNDHAWTGCTTTAIAQVLAYWKYPANYNWSAMSTYSSDAAAVLMGDIFPCVIDDYNTRSSGCTNDFHITHTFLNKFNYSSASLAGNVNGWIYNGGYNYSTVINNLDAGQPVILGAFTSITNILNLTAFPKGTGHTWVCDGYIETTFSFDTHLLFHMNWGWNGTFNG